MKVLVVEDEPEVARAIELCISSHWPNSKVITTGKGSQATVLLTTEAPDVAILDLALPDMDGLDVLRDPEILRYVPAHCER